MTERESRTAPESRVQLLEDVAATAQAFVGTTSYYRQAKTSRNEFERLAVALLALHTPDSGGLQSPDSSVVVREEQ